MKNNDEFNSVKITNESGNSPTFEFGKTQRGEFSSYKENKTTTNKDEINSTANKNNENFKKLKDNSSTEYVKKTLTSGGTTAASSAGAATSSVGAVTGSVIAATVVTVSTIASVAGISVISNNNATVRFEYFDVGESYVSYVLELKDTNGAKFRLYVESQTYSSYRELEEGWNEGTFEMLTYNQSYRIYVQENSDNKKIIYDSNFTTMKEALPEPEFYSIYFSKTANFVDYTFTVTLDYQDEANRLSDFVLVMYDQMADAMSKTFYLEKTTEPQTLSGLDEETGEVILDVRNGRFGFSLTYLLDEDENYYGDPDNVIGFESDGTGRSEFNELVVSEAANFSTNTFTVTLDYVDDFDLLSDFSVTMESAKSGQGSVGMLNSFTFPLEKTTDSQLIDFSEFAENNPSIIQLNNFNFTLNYNYDGIGDTYVVSSHSFIDSTPTINETTIFEEADLALYTFDLQLDYVDNYDQIDEFVLEMTSIDYTSDSVVTEIKLEKTTDIQTINYALYNESKPSLLRTNAFTINLIYFEHGKQFSYLIDEEFRFTDKEGRESTASVSVLSEADFISYEFTIELELDDPFHAIDDVMLHIGPSEYSMVDIALEAIDGEQTIAAKDNDGEVIVELTTNEAVMYKLTYTVDGNLVEGNSGDVIFIDSEYEPTFNGITFDESADFVEGIFYVTLDYVDVFEEAYDSFELALSPTTEPAGSDPYRFELEPTNTKQEVSVLDYGINLAKGPFSYTLTYRDIATDQYVTGADGFISFTSNRTSEFRELICDYKAVEDNQGNYQLPLRIDYIDEENIYRDLYLVINNDFDNVIRLMNSNGWQYATIPYEDLETDITLGLYAFVYSYETEETTEDVALFSTETNIEIDNSNAVYGARLAENSIPYSDPYINIYILTNDYNGDNFSNYMLMFIVDGQFYLVDIDTSGSETLERLNNLSLIGQTQLIEKLQEGKSADIYLSYRRDSTGETDRIQFASSVTFTFYA